MLEIFKDIPGYEGIYKISPHGVLKICRNKTLRGNGLMKPFINNNGYLRVSLFKNGISKKQYIHQLVAITYCKGYDPKKYVNHIDGNKLNNHYSNLEWVTAKENCQHAIKTGLKKAMTLENKIKLSIRSSGGRNNKAKKVINIETGEQFETIKAAASSVNINVWNLHAYLQGRNPNKTPLKYA